MFHCIQMPIGTTCRRGNQNANHPSSSPHTTLSLLRLSLLLAVLHMYYIAHPQYTLKDSITKLIGIKIWLFE